MALSYYFYNDFYVRLGFDTFCDFYLLTVIIFKFLLELELLEFFVIPTFTNLVSYIDYFLFEFEFVLRLVT